MPPVPNKIDSMSVAGIGNAAAGTLAADALKSIFTDRYNKPATKGDLIALGNKIQRFQLVKNLAPGIGGALPYFDMETKNIVYRNHNDLIP
ncbi:hypothetical protein D9O36_13965 [Zobellia amurskyensis]|uniref:Uncharacterized protein n=2 Tax=Zobellia amurskyensis TaxID=248905 RepID=A0A7X2ZV63_9FLAO|nr:hypothetical protein [Zobellia amurskyensis]